MLHLACEISYVTLSLIVKLAVWFVGNLWCSHWVNNTVYATEHGNISIFGLRELGQQLTNKE